MIEYVEGTRELSAARWCFWGGVVLLGCGGFIATVIAAFNGWSEVPMGAAAVSLVAIVFGNLTKHFLSRARRA